MSFDVALCQYALGSADSLDELLDCVGALFDRAGPADCYVLPELLLDDPGLAGPDPPEVPVLDDVEPYHGALREAAAARDAVVVGGSYNCRLDGGAPDEGSVVNRTPVVTPDDLRVYDKRHPTPGERDSGKRRGTADPPVVSHDGVGVGVLCCYDVEFPETVRALVDRGAEVLAVPSWTEDDAGHERVSRCAAARAVENQAYVAHVPLVGRRGDVGGVGRGAVYAPCDDVVGPDGTRLSLPRNEAAAATCRLDVDALRESRERATVRPYTDAREEFA